MRVLVTGASGFVGRPLVRRLLERGHEVVALSRDIGRAAASLPVRCECRTWDPASGRISAGTVQDCDAIVHLAGEGVADKAWNPQRKQAVLASRVQATGTLIAALRALPPASRPQVLVAASAIGFYGDRGNEELDETATAGQGFLADVCKAWEAESRGAEELGVRTAILRIGIVLGKDGGALAKMLPPFQLGIGGRLGDGKAWMSWIHIEDLVELFVRAVESHELKGVINAVAPQPLTNAEFTKALGRALRRPALLPVPRLALNAVLGEMASLLLASQRVLSTAAQRSGFQFRYADIDQALASLVDGEHEILTEQWVKRPLPEVFDFFSNANNLEQLTPAFLNFRVLGTSTPTLQEGTHIDYKLSLHGIPMKWQSRIEAWQPNKQFVDTQVRGPYQLWHHTHEFEECQGGTILRDRVRYRMPLGGFGDALATPLVKRDLKTIFDFRRQRAWELFGR